jgi:DNA helicase-2/ATP-dependent DNA helicase PcrA
MNIRIEDLDFEQLRNQFPDLDFNDEELREVLRRMDTLEVQAAPGSGKTTLLGAKLTLIASKWPYERRGICILSHTNVAREEIARRLQSSVEGRYILRYPHFLGTIQTFVHTFLALPFLRSHGVSPDVIDDEYFADQAMLLAGYDKTLSLWLANAPRAAGPVVQTLRYEGEKLALGCANGSMPGEGTKSRPRLASLKKKLTDRGVFRYDDMFAFAECLLNRHPVLRTTLSYRFPLLFLDEMQDTSGSQESLLTKIFDETVVVQRFGDVNQRILNNSQNGTVTTFPRDGYVSVSTSKRFGQPIAEVANKLRMLGPDIVGKGPTAVAPPTMFLYDDETIGNVIPTFGAYVAGHFSQHELATGRVKAVCARKQGDSKKGLGRHILDYWPTFDVAAGKPVAARPRFIDVIRGLSSVQGRGLGEVQSSLDSVRMALLKVLRVTGNDEIKRSRTWGDLAQRLDQSANRLSILNRIVRDLVIEPPDILSEPHWGQFVTKLFHGLQPLLDGGVTEEGFRKTEYLAYDAPFSPGEIASQSRNEGNTYESTIDGKTVRVELATIAGVKGETHLATLVLESFQQSAFDISEAIPYLCGNLDSTTVVNSRLQGQLRNLFVGVTRPTRLLCLAMHRERLSEDYRVALTNMGWVLRDC